MLDVTVDVEGLEHLSDRSRKYTFVSNHPLGAIDGVTLGMVLGRHFDGKIKYLVNDLLMNLKGLAPLCIPINKMGKQARNFPQLVAEAFSSDNQIVMFPAGICSRRMPDGEIRDLDWNKTFITKSVMTQRDVVPIHFIGRNSDRFYSVAEWCRRLHLKFNFAQLFLPDEMYGVRVWKGVEIDIVDFEGHLAFEDRPDEFHPEKTGAELLLSSRDFVIASIHTPFDRDRGTVEQNTAMYLAVLRNPYVDALGHTGRAGHAYELAPVLLEAKRLGKAIELNNASLQNSAAASAKPCRAIAEACRDLGVPVTVSSDCHSAFGIGCFSEVERLLWEIGFPEELIVNRTRESFEQFLEGRRRRLAALAGA